MAKAKKVRVVDSDLPEGWEAHEEHPEEKKKESGFHLSNNMLWVLFIVLVIAFALFFMSKNSQPKEMQTTYVNGIAITALQDPVTTIKNLVYQHIEGKRLDESEDSHNALNEILVVIGQSGRPAASSSKYTLFAGISDKTGISTDEGVIRIEGATRREFWKAIWTFNSIISGLEIDSDVDFFDVQQLLAGRSEVYLVQDMENTCLNYGHIISAEGDILLPLGYKQAELGFKLLHYRKDGDICAPFSNESASAECPQPSDDVFVITMVRRESSLLTISENEIIFQYSDCNTVDRMSIILGDMLYPNIISSISTVSFPTEI